MISIAMATYNGSKYIREQLDSFKTQTIQNYELVVCDDYSTDDTWAILQEYAIKDNRIKLYKNDKNLGYRRNFEKLVTLCTGDYIAFSDQDDIWCPNHLEILYDNIGENAVCTANAEIVGDKGEKLGYKLTDYTGMRNFPENDLDKAYIYFYYLNPFPGCNTMYRKSFLEFAYPIKHDGIRLHDTFADTLACFSRSGLVFVDEVTLLYRFHNNSVTSSSKKRFMSPLRCLIRKLTLDPARKSTYVDDRSLYCKEFQSKNMMLDDEQKDFISFAYKYHTRRNSIWGRIENFLFDLKHYKRIYMK